MGLGQSGEGALTPALHSGDGRGIFSQSPPSSVSGIVVPFSRAVFPRSTGGGGGHEERSRSPSTVLEGGRSSSACEVQK